MVAEAVGRLRVDREAAAEEAAADADEEGYF